MSKKNRCVLIIFGFLQGCAGGGSTSNPSTTQKENLSITVTPSPSPSSALIKHQNIACTLVKDGGTCHYIITLNQGSSAGIGYNTIKKGTNYPITEGQRVCLKGSNNPYSSLRFEDIVGSAAKPVEFINCGGQFVIGNNVDANNDGKVDLSQGITFINSKHIKVTGTGSPSHTYGIKLAGTDSGRSALVFTTLSSDIEAEFVEISHAGFAGIMAKTDPACTDTNAESFRGGFVQKNSVFHDNYIHDVGGEGFYIGYSFFQGYSANKSCLGTKLYSHPVEGVKIYNNKLERTGCEAIQVGNGSLVEVYNNNIKDYGLSPFANYQNNGIQIGQGTSGHFYNNLIVNSDPSFLVGAGIIIIGYKDTHVYNNTIVNAGTGTYIHEAFSQNQYDEYEPYKLYYHHNTIINPTGAAAKGTQAAVNPRGIWIFNSQAQMELSHNLILLGAVRTNITQADHIKVNSIFDQKVSWTISNNGQTGTNISTDQNIKDSIINEAQHLINHAQGDYDSSQ